MEGMTLVGRMLVGEGSGEAKVRWVGEGRFGCMARLAAAISAALSASSAFSQ